MTKHTELPKKTKKRRRKLNTMYCKKKGMDLQSGAMQSYISVRLAG